MDIGKQPNARELHIQKACIKVFGPSLVIVPSPTCWRRVVEDGYYHYSCLLPVGECGCTVAELPQLMSTAFGGTLLKELERLNSGKGTTCGLWLKFENMSDNFMFIGVGGLLGFMARRNKEVTYLFPPDDSTRPLWKISIPAEFISFVSNHKLMLG